MSKRTRHVWEFVETLTGPIVYLGFFGLTYFATSLVCALSRGNAPIVTDAPALIAATTFALALTAILLIALLMGNAGRMLANAGEDKKDGFMGLVTLTLAILSALAVVWTAVPAATLPPTC